MNRQNKGKIRPKISTMPRQRTEAAALLDLYKLAIEKERLSQELVTIDQRRQQILDRMVVLEQQVIQLEQRTKQLRQAESASMNSALAEGRSPSTADSFPNPSFHSTGFDTLQLDY
jgi:hypothetical protein